VALKFEVVPSERVNNDLLQAPANLRTPIKPHLIRSLAIRNGLLKALRFLVEVRNMVSHVLPEADGRHDGCAAGARFFGTGGLVTWKIADTTGVFPWAREEVEAFRLGRDGAGACWNHLTDSV
jgi:hypothetical protein